MNRQIWQFCIRCAFSLDNALRFDYILSIKHKDTERRPLMKVTKSLYIGAMAVLIVAFTAAAQVFTPDL
jgi:hypothetical protein